MLATLRSFNVDVTMAKKMEEDPRVKHLPPKTIQATLTYNDCTVVLGRRSFHVSSMLKSIGFAQVEKITALRWVIDLSDQVNVPFLKANLDALAKEETWRVELVD